MQLFRSRGDKEIELVLNTGEYRPTGIFVVTKENKVLIAKSLIPGEAGAYSLPQGGFKSGESRKENLIRELHEEYPSINRNQLKNFREIRNVFTQDFSDKRSLEEKLRGRPHRGKKYFPATVQYVGRWDLQLNSQEVASYQWVSFEEARIILGANPRKGQILFQILNQV